MTFKFFSDFHNSFTILFSLKGQKKWYQTTCINIVYYFCKHFYMVIPKSQSYSILYILTLILAVISFVGFWPRDVSVDCYFNCLSLVTRFYLSPIKVICIGCYLIWRYLCNNQLNIHQILLYSTTQCHCHLQHFYLLFICSFQTHIHLYIYPPVLHFVLIIRPVSHQRVFQCEANQ